MAGVGRGIDEPSYDPTSDLTVLKQPWLDRLGGGWRDAVTRVLLLMDERRDDKARQTLELQRDNALDASYRMTASDNPIVGSFVARQLLPGLDRTASYLADTDAGNHLLAWAQGVKKYIQRASVGQ